jgi:beta-mannosidase
MTMLRIWGGGIYEHDAFYDLCDRYGILIWQDFMFACAMYPDHDPAFRREVENEARYQVRRLRNHPCLALWCGNNENQWIHDKEVWEKGGTEPVPGSFLYHHLLPVSSPSWMAAFPIGRAALMAATTTTAWKTAIGTNWTVWHGDQPRRFGEKAQTVQTPAGVSFLHYLQDQGRFISEFGMHASPVFETLRRVHSR